MLWQKTFFVYKDCHSIFKIYFIIIMPSDTNWRRTSWTSQQRSYWRPNKVFLSILYLVVCFICRNRKWWYQQRWWLGSRTEQNGRHYWGQRLKLKMTSSVVTCGIMYMCVHHICEYFNSLWSTFFPSELIWMAALAHPSWHQNSEPLSIAFLSHKS